MLLMSLLSVGSIKAAPAASAAGDYDIPISELNRVKKKGPAKRAPRESKKQQKSSATPQELPSEPGIVAHPADATGQVKSPNVEAVQLVPVAAPLSKTPVTAAPQINAEAIQIFHTPYSFVVADKLTVIHAVIYRTSDIREVHCSLPALPDGTAGLVKMTPVDGTQFTYTATLPGLTSETASLRYTIVVVDAQGSEIRSKEFMTPVTTSPVVPGWQHDSAGDAIPVTQEE
jgi:hypothetical protein